MGCVSHALVGKLRNRWKTASLFLGPNSVASLLLLLRLANCMYVGLVAIVGIVTFDAVKCEGFLYDRG
jgi:hypothetical protein